MKLFSLKIAVISGVVLIVGGLAVVVPSLYYHYQQVNAKPAPLVLHNGQPATQAVNQEVKTYGTPVSISIPSVDISDNVIPGVYNTSTREWTLTLDKAQFATISTLPNPTAGDTYIYGHYRPEVFAYLHVIKPGALATVNTNKGYQFTYRFDTSRVTSPSDTSVFNYSGPAIMTLQTCTGAFFQNRQLFTFNYVSYQKLT